MDNQAIIVRRGENAPGWVNVSFAGELGCVSGLNEHGVAAMIHVAFGADKSSDRSGIVPGTLALRRALEAAGPASGPADADALLDSLPGLGAYTFIMVFGSAGRTDDQIAGVFEYDGNQAGSDGRSTWRKPSDNPSLPHSALRDQRIERSDELINVNHYLKRKTWVPVWFSSGRYVHIKHGLERDSADGLLDADEAAAIIAGTGLAPSWILGPWCTLHTVVVQPRQGLLRVYLAADGRPGYEQQPLELSLAELLAQTPK